MQEEIVPVGGEVGGGVWWSKYKIGNANISRMILHADPLRRKIIFHSICEAFSCCVIGEDISDELICHGLRLRRVFLLNATPSLLFTE